MSNREIRPSLIIWTLAVCFLLGAGYYLFFYSSAFKVEKIKAWGTDRGKLIIARVENALLKRKPLFFLPENMFFWSASFLKKEKPSWLEFSDIALERSFLKKSVSIFVQKRQPAGITCFEKKCFFFDKEGFIFAFAPYSRGSLCPVVVKNSPLALGSYFLGKQSLPIFLNYLGQFKKMSLMADLYRIDEKNKEVEIRIRLPGPENSLTLKRLTKFNLYLSLEFPTPDLKEKLAVLSRKVDFSKIKYLDLRIKDKVYYK